MRWRPASPTWPARPRPRSPAPRWRSTGAWPASGSGPGHDAPGGPPALGTRGLARLEPLGRSGVEVTELALGGAAIGNLYAEVDEATAAATVDAAWNGGIRLFDVAPHYGLGLAERRLGAALAARPRDKYVISTKIGRLLVPVAEPVGRDADGFGRLPMPPERHFDYSADGVRASIEASLGRLGLDRIDIALIHDPDDHEEQALAEAYPAPGGGCGPRASCARLAAT